MLPSVSLPRSPYLSASGISPMPTLSSTIQTIRLNDILFGKGAFDARRKLVDEAVWKKPVHTAGHSAVFVHQNRSRNIVDLQEPLEAVVQVDRRPAPLLLLKEWTHQQRIFIRIDR